jgi:hypothetical protein
VPREKHARTREGDSREATHSDDLVRSLAQSLAAATAAGQWDVVKVLADELRALRHERDGVVDIAARRMR